MCGIIGFTRPNQNKLKQATTALAHRGPDAAGYFTDSHISLGHRRLSIIDLSSAANQPMHHDNLTIIFNGEIYNFQEITHILKKKGHTFKLNSDTEVILHAYQEWGMKCVNKFNGMWAFAIYDNKAKSLFLSRDRFGIKPLYYYHDSKSFIFASEVRAIKLVNPNLSLNHQAINSYFYYKFIPGALSIYQKVFKLPPGHSLLLDLKTNQKKLYPYYFLQQEISELQDLSIQSRIELIKKTLDQSVTRRLIADVPVGSFLSGGLDSSLISAIIAKQHPSYNTFSIGFRESTYNELPFAKKVARSIGIKNISKTVSLNESTVNHIIKHLDEPFGDPSVIPTYVLSELTKSHVTVSLSGDGADEIFGGYDTYLGNFLTRYVPKPIFPFLKSLSPLLPATDAKVSLGFKINRFLRNVQESDIQKRHLDWMSAFSDQERQLFLPHITRNYFKSRIKPKPQSSLLTTQLLDIQEYLPNNILRKLDFASMSHGLEARVPYLDPQLVPLALSLPDKYKIRNFSTKWQLKQIASHYLDKEIVHRKKRGFSVPISKWFKQSSAMQAMILDPVNYSHDLIDRRQATKLIHTHLAGHVDNSRQLWLIYVFNSWHQQHA